MLKYTSSSMDDKRHSNNMNDEKIKVFKRFGKNEQMN
jgi:hypothetical protein